MTSIMLLCVLALVGAVSAIPVEITRAEIDDHKIDADETNRLDIVRDENVEFELVLEASENVDDVEVMIFVSGFDHNQDVRLADFVGPFDMDEGVTYRKTLDITFPDLVNEDDYKVRVIVSNRNDVELVQNYNVKIDVPRHKLKIVDASFSPSRTVQAGQALLATVRVENFGEKDEDDVKVTVSIPDLGVSASDHIEEIEYDDEESSEELYLRLPKCAEPGLYDMVLTVEYNDGFDRTSVQGEIEVLENPFCETENTVVVQTPPQEDEMVDAVPRKDKARTALEIILLVLVALLVLIGLIIGFSRMGGNDQE